MNQIDEKYTTFDYQGCMNTPSCNECENSEICTAHAIEEGYL